jgi:hypothetical protein
VTVSALNGQPVAASFDGNAVSLTCRRSDERLQRSIEVVG